MLLSIFLFFFPPFFAVDALALWNTPPPQPLLGVPSPPMGGGVSLGVKLRPPLFEGWLGVLAEAKKGEEEEEGRRGASTMPREDDEDGKVETTEEEAAEASQEIVAAVSKTVCVASSSSS